MTVILPLEWPDNITIAHGIADMLWPWKEATKVGPAIGSELGMPN